MLLLVKLCGTDERIDGLTKMAKLDFFVRYPQFFVTACATLGKNPGQVPESIESSMVRYHYGPWDRRYYHVVAYLESRELLKVEKTGKAFSLVLTPLGQQTADKLASEPSFGQLTGQMKKVKLVLGKMTGSRLKSLVYRVFDKEVAERQIGEVIA